MSELMFPPPEHGDMDALRIVGGFARDDGEPFTPESAEEFFDAFIAWIEDRGIGFGGSLGWYMDEELKP